jgi:putative hydrolase of the HAD superfamily
MESTHAVKAVLFDAGNTLLRVERSVGEIYAGAATAFGVYADPTEIDARFREVFKERDGDLCNYTSEDTERLWWRMLVETVFERAGCLDAFGKRFDAYFTELHALFAQENNWRVFDDTAPTLETLHAMGLRRAVASNWDSRLPSLLETVGLRSHFEFVLTSAEVGRAKPHPLLFERSLERFGLAPEEVIYVGDSYGHDVVGARNAGVTAVLIERGKQESYPDAEVLGALSELPHWLTSKRRAG